MLAMIPFPDISPEIFTLSLGGFEFSLRWYALAYILGCLLAFRISLAALNRPASGRSDTPPMSKDHLEDLLLIACWALFLAGGLAM